MTARQKEFCRAYVAGYPAAKAAIAAGYAKSTAERNAAHFLEHPAIQSRIATIRARKGVVSCEDMHLAKDRLVAVLNSDPGPHDLFRACQELCRIARLQSSLELDTYGALKEDILQAEMDQGLIQFQHEDEPGYRAEAEQEKDGAILHELHAKLHDPEGVRYDCSQHTKPRHFDRTPDGHIAFDQPQPHKTQRRQPLSTINSQLSTSSPTDPLPLFLAQGLGPGKHAPETENAINTSETGIGTNTPETGLGTKAAQTLIATNASDTDFAVNIPKTSPKPTPAPLSTLNPPLSTFSRSLKTAYRHQNLQKTQQPTP